MNSLVSPWHAWLDPTKYREHADSVEAMGVMTVATAHGPVLTGDAIEAFDVVRDLAGKPIIPAPARVLDEIVAQVLAGAAA